MPDAAGLLAAANNSKEWLTYGHDYTNDRYSGLDQINVRLIGELRGAGSVEFSLIIAGRRSNTATIKIL